MRNYVTRFDFNMNLWYNKDMKNLRTLEIVEFVKRRKFCSIAELMAEFGVSPATIHRDIAFLVKNNLVSKVRGGLAAREETGNSGIPMEQSGHYRERLGRNREAKECIARKALAEIRDGDIIFLDSSTTVYCLAKLLQTAQFTDLTIITNSLLIIQEFPLFPPQCFLVALGGNYDLQLNAFLGKTTMRDLESLTINRAFLSALGVSGDGIYSRHENHSYFLRRVLEIADEGYLLLSSDKFGKSGLFEIAPVNKITKLLSDATDCSEMR